MFSRRAVAGALWILCPLLLVGCPSRAPEPVPQQQPAAEDPAATRSATSPADDQRRIDDETAAVTDESASREEQPAAASTAASTAAEERPTAEDVGVDPPPVDPRPLESPLASDADAPASDPLGLDDGKDPAEIAAEKAFAAPDAMHQLSPDARLWIDRERGRVVVDGYVTLREGPLEMFACPVGTKEHESVVAVLASSSNVHTALLAIGAMSGTPVSFVPEYRPATGQRIAIWVMWRDAEGEIQKAPAQQWVERTGTGKPLEPDWVFAGSSFWRDPETGQEHYTANSGDLVCVSNFSTATLDLPVESSDSNAALQYSAFTEHLPPRGTPVRLVFVPIPLPADEPDPQAENKADPRAPPEDELLEVQQESENPAAGP